MLPMQVQVHMNRPCVACGASWGWPMEPGQHSFPRIWQASNLTLLLNCRHRMLRKVGSCVTDTSSRPDTLLAMSSGQNRSTAARTYSRTLKRLLIRERQSSQQSPMKFTMSSRLCSGTKSSPAAHAPPDEPMAHTFLKHSSIHYRFAY